MILRFMEGPRSGKTITINHDDFTIGRDDSCNLLLSEDGISRLHCRIVKKDDTFTIKDNGSTNSIYVNGTKIPETHELKQNDTIRIGDCLLLFSSDESQLDSNAMSELNHIRDEKKSVKNTETPDKESEENKEPAPEKKPAEATDEEPSKKETPAPDETQDHTSTGSTTGEVELNFARSKKNAANDSEEADEEKGLGALLSGSTGVMVAVVVILIIILLYVLIS